VSKSAEIEKPFPQHCLVSGPFVQLPSAALGDAELDEDATGVELVLLETGVTARAAARP